MGVALDGRPARAVPTQPGELRGLLTVVPEARWIKNPTHMESFDGNTLDHYREHTDDLRAVLEAAGS